MADDRPWYREPETFIAVAALVASISAVVVGMYEAHLQRCSATQRSTPCGSAARAVGAT